MKVTPGGKGPGLVWKWTKVTGRLMYTSGKREAQPVFADSLEYNLNTQLFFSVHFWTQAAANDAQLCFFFLVFFLPTALKCVKRQPVSMPTWRSDPVPPTSFILIQPHLHSYPPSALGALGFTPLEAGVHFLADVQISPLIFLTCFYEISHLRGDKSGGINRMWA